MKALGQILLYLAAVVVIGALLAPSLFWIARSLAVHIHGGAVTAFLLKVDFPRCFDRAVMITALIFLWPLLRSLGIGNFGPDLGLERDRRGWPRLGTGVAVAFGTFACLGAILIFTGIYRLHSHLPYGKLAWLPVTALAVALIEEFLFRGALQGAVSRTAIDGFAMISVAVVYAAVHFLKPPSHDLAPGIIHWWSGLSLLPETFSQFRQPALLLGGFSTLLIVGLILGYARDRTRSLWMPVGLHSGWILGKMGLLDITRHPAAAWPWVGPDLLIGLAPLITLLAAWSILWWMFRDAR